MVASKFVEDAARRRGRVVTGELAIIQSIYATTTNNVSRVWKDNSTIVPQFIRADEREENKKV